MVLLERIPTQGFSVETTNVIRGYFKVKSGNFTSPEELVVKYKHFREPDLYLAILSEHDDELTPSIDFEVREFPSVMPIFARVFNPSKYRPDNTWKYYTEGQEEAYREHLAEFKLEYSEFTRKVLREARKRKDVLSNPARSVVVAELFDTEEWANSKIDRETIEPLGIGVSYCSFKEKQVNHSVGRGLAFQKAVTDYLDIYA